MVVALRQRQHKGHMVVVALDAGGVKRCRARTRVDLGGEGANAQLRQAHLLAPADDCGLVVLRRFRSRRLHGQSLEQVGVTHPTQSCSYRTRDGQGKAGQGAAGNLGLQAADRVYRDQDIQGRGLKMTPAGRNFPLVMQLTAEVQRRLGKHDLGTRGGTPRLPKGAAGNPTSASSTAARSARATVVLTSHRQRRIQTRNRKKYNRN